jgi:hypothetical protein
MVQVTEAGGRVAPGSAGRVLVTLITPGQGSSGFYSPEVLEAAATDRVFAAGTHMHADHPSRMDVQDRPERSILTLVGQTVEDARWDPAVPGLVAEAQLFGPLGQTVAQMQDAIGVSIRATADVEEADQDGRRVTIVKRLDTAESVDFVTRAGRGGRFVVLESARTLMAETDPPPHTEPPVTPAGTTTPQGETMAEVEETERRVTAAEAARDQAVAEAAAARAEADTARAQLAAHGTIGRVLAEANLPTPTYARVLEATVLRVTAGMDDTAVKALAETARDDAKAEVAAIAQSLGAGTPRGIAYGSGGDREVSEADLDATLDGIFANGV